ncbi:PREDICTED: ubinuclein-1-like [Amphimedon queenslandica]|uniref:Ubinuclein middle domain-containing protein n=1 Tax=Amphimedon queenslandica TaxID=400682 RepID=A0A1X7UDD4_AMPQE|nr:PREDICTED: ubinuclein-1-like [Amphimedon queenslandica]XP_019854942.1 PREDICTED: ubinuclein-1-like [Amphimedon queenslandica]|eukprot:XP_019854941.1 PREDICTED: ubinuclein-1-like [Amphimedon queenslandica]
MNLETILNNGRQKGANKGRESSLGGAGLRLEVKLLAPTDERSNEVSYPQLVSKRIRELGVAVGGVGPQKQEPPPFGKETLPLLPGEDDEDQKLAAIAKKFEEKYGASTQDLVDIGEGYDTNDSFVDDSELYEDYVPPQVDTMFGGFYVNTGELEFTKNKNLTDFGLSAKSKEEKPKKRHMNTPQAIANKKLKQAKRQMAVSSAQRSHILKKKLTLTSPAIEEKKQAPVAMETGPSPPLIINEETESSIGAIDSKTTCPSLPDGLPLTLINKIKQIEESLSVDHANSSTGKLTCKVKTSYDKQLVDIDNDCKSLKIKTRVTVLEYLAYKFGINRTSLMNRIKRVLKKQETGIVDLDAALAQLKEAVNLAMLPLLSKYKIDLEKYETERKQLEDTPTPAVKVESPGDDPSPAPVVANGKKLQKPQRKFTWTERIRLLLVTVVKAKVEKELMNKTRTQTGEEIILEFIETHVRPLWPKGWVQKKALYKMTESAHFKLTQSDSQLKKPVQVKKEKLLKDDSLTQSSSVVSQASITTPTTSDVSLSQKGTGSTTLVNTPQISQTSPIKATPTLIKGRADLTTPIIKTATPPSPHKRVGLATPPKLVSPTVNKSPPVDFTDLQTKLKSIPPIIIKGASPIANLGMAKGATPPPLLIKGASPSVGVSVPSSRSVITGATKDTPSHTNVITSRGVTPPSKVTPPSIDPRHKVVKKSAKVQSVQLPKQTIDALLSVLKNTNSSIYTSDLAQLVTVTTRQQTTPTQRPVTLSPTQSSLRIVQAPPPATPPSTIPSVHPLTDHYYVTGPSPVQYVPASTSGVSLITSNFINKTSSNN